jgi:XXXCH domain-containing protein
MGDKSTATMSRQDLTARLEELARGLKAGRLEVEGKVWSVPDELAAEVQIKEKKGSLVVKLKCRWATLGEYQPEARERAARWQESLKAVKERMAAQFKEFKAAAAQGQVPAPQLVADFMRDSQVMADLTEPEWGEAMQSFLAQAAALERAVTSGDVEAAKHEITDIETAMNQCHKEFK